MWTKTKLAFVAAILFGSVSGAVAEEYDVDIFRPIPQTYPSSNANARWLLERRNATRFTPEEKAWFDRASRLD